MSLTGHSGIGDAVQDGVAEAGFAFHSGAPCVADGRGAFTSEAILAVASGAAHVEAGAAGFDGVGVAEDGV